MNIVQGCNQSKFPIAACRGGGGGGGGGCSPTLVCRKPHGSGWSDDTDPLREKIEI